MRHFLRASSGSPMRCACLLVILAACGSSGGNPDATGGDDSGGDDSGGDDASPVTDAPAVDGLVTIDADTTPDAAHVPDAHPPDAPLPPDAMTGVITGGPCSSGSPGATAYRVRWARSGSTAYVIYEVNGLPDHSRDHTGAYGYVIGYTPQFVDPFLGRGGLQLDSGNFVDIEITTAGVSNITSATLSIYGRSFHTTTSGSFDWQTFLGTGAAPTNLVSNVPPYQWYSADMTTEIGPNDPNTLIRIKAGPTSGVLVVNRIEICMQAT